MLSPAFTGKYRLPEASAANSAGWLPTGDDKVADCVPLCGLVVEIANDPEALNTQCRLPLSNPGFSTGCTTELLRLALVPSGLVTVTPTVPAACAGVFAVMLVLLTTTTFVATVPPKLTVAPETKPVPVRVTLV